MDGGIFGLLGLIARHRGAVEYDWRTRFHLPLSAINGEQMTLAEAGRHAATLRRDPSSAICAALEGWAHPISREAMLLADLFDLQHMSKAKKRPKPYPRPWAILGDTKRRGDAGGRTRAQVIEILRQFGHG